jgi:hypothetical protein
MKKEQKEDSMITYMCVIICNKNNTAITDLESGKIICGNCDRLPPRRLKMMLIKKVVYIDRRL